jgi:hypothetical protein
MDLAVINPLYYSNACKNRSTASTKMNVSSSRSHAILSFQVTVAVENGEPQEGDDDSDSEQYALSGKINLIDLAGSEDNRRTDNGKERLAESGAINKSLFVLGQVVESINAASVRIHLGFDRVCFGANTNLLLSPVSHPLSRF